MNDPLYVRAREVLLDALGALGDHAGSIVLVGAQAIYLRVGAGDLPVPPYTTDGDLAVDPRGLRDEPLLAEALRRAHLSQRAGSPGVWLAEDSVQIDLLVPEELARRPGRRGADLGPHGSKVSRQVKGLVAAVIDSTMLNIGALGEADARSFRVAVANKGGLLVAKLHKIADRTGTDRQSDKDALDILRILRGSGPGELAVALRALRADPVAGPTTGEGIELLRSLFGSPAAEGSRMAGNAAQALVPEGELEASCAALAAELLRDL